MKDAVHTVPGSTSQRVSPRTYTHAVCINQNGLVHVHRWSQSEQAALEYARYLVNKGYQGVEVRAVTREEGVTRLKRTPGDERGAL